MPTAQPAAPPHAPSVDKAEIAKFSAMAEEWWDPYGKFRPLHQLNPARLTYIRDQICTRFDKDPSADTPLTGLRLLDIGCGGGLLSEPMHRLGADVLGADMSAVNIEIAKTHAASQGLALEYQCIAAEDLLADGQDFDVILNMEVIEHVADMPAFIATCLALLKPGGLMLVSTINHTLKALGLAVIGAEYIMRWLPVGTHHFDKFIKPEELRAAITKDGFGHGPATGISYAPLSGQWHQSTDLSVNYMMPIWRER